MVSAWEYGHAAVDEHQRLRSGGHNGGDNSNMYAVIRHHKVKGPQADELARQGKEDFVPIIRKMPGLIAYTIIASDERVSTVSIFEDKASAEESTRRAITWAAKRVTDFDVPTEVIEGNVVVHEVP